MKQTNNAIKFLMAQYRAIFQNAYFKGLATAAVVTIGLAAGQAQANKESGSSFTGEPLAPMQGETLIITGSDVSDPTSGDNLDKYKFIQISANKTFDKDISIQGGDAATAGNYVSGSAPTTFTAKSLTVSGTAATNGLLIQGAENKAATAIFTDGVNVQAGVISLTGAKANNGTGTLQSTTIDVGSATVTTGASIELAGTATQVGYALAGDGADGEDVEAGTPKSTSDYTTLSIIKNGSLVTKTGADTTGAVVDAAVLDINGGAINVTKNSSKSDLTLNIVKGDLNAGTITTVDGGTLAIKFASGDFVDDKNALVDKKLTLTSGTLSLGSDITLSGEGQLVVANNGDAIKSTGAKGITLTNGAAFAPKDVENAKTVAGNLPIKIGEKGVLDFGSTAADLDQLTFASEASKADSTIGLDAAGIIKGDTLSLTKKLGADGIVSGKTVNLGDSGTSNDITGGKIHASQTLNIGKNVKAIGQTHEMIEITL